MSWTISARVQAPGPSLRFCREVIFFCQCGTWSCLLQCRYLQQLVWSPNCADFCSFHLIRYRFVSDTDGENKREQSDRGSVLLKTVQLESQSMRSNHTDTAAPRDVKSIWAGWHLPLAVICRHCSLVSSGRLCRQQLSASASILLSLVHQDPLTSTGSAWDPLNQMI